MTRSLPHARRRWQTGLAQVSPFPCRMLLTTEPKSLKDLDELE
ncbi:unnamed protein product [Rhodiola kirilowii]